MQKYEYSFRALWTSCLISIINENENWLNDLINNAYDQIVKFENEFSRFKEDSLLNQLNREKKLEINMDFWFLVNKSKEIYKLTNWYFNPLINVNKIWYSSDFNSQNFEKLEIWENLDFNDVKIYWNLLEIWENMNLDFWSIAKWYLAEKISNFITDNWYKNNLVNMWWDIYASWTNLSWEKWKIAIANPNNPDEAITNLSISNSSISTSWTYIRKWKIDETEYHHIRNPFTEKQNDELVSVTIIHKDWYMTDALATAIIAMWKEIALKFCEENNIKYYFILKNWDILQNI